MDTPVKKVYKCFNCKEEGHFAGECSKEKKVYKCFNCKEEGHFADTCTKEKKLKRPATNKPHPNCPGFVLAQKVLAGCSTSDEFVMGRDFDDEGTPFTDICNHEQCMPGLEYLYPVIVALADLDFEHDIYRNILKKVPEFKTKDVNCSGFVFDEKNEITADESYIKRGRHIHQYSNIPFTEKCMHFECDPSARNRFVLMCLGAVNYIDEDILRQIDDINARNLFESGNTKSNIDEYIKTVEKNRSIWSPLQAQNYSTVMEENKKAKTDDGDIHCWYRATGKEKKLRIRMKFGTSYFGFPMDKTPRAVELMTKFWSITKQPTDELKNVLENALNVLNKKD
jgi:Zinc knuckle